MNAPSLFPLTCACFVAFVATARAFPPAPYYTLYGIVRDQVGQTLPSEGAEVVLLKGGVEIGRAPISAQLGAEQNYELNVRIDQNLAGTALYTANAVPAEGLYGLMVLVQGELYYPIEASGPLTTGKGSERKRLDLTLGNDDDRDGLPDVWEQWQLYQAGEFPDAEGHWEIERLDKEGDFDKDGQSNYVEYLAGTFAGDPTESFKLNIAERRPDEIRFEFFGVTGKTYVIERSTDNLSWAPMPFSVVRDPLVLVDAFRAVSSGIQSAYVAPGAASAKEFFRLTVR